MKNISKFLFLLFSICILVNFAKPCAVSAAELNKEDLKTFLDSTMKESYEKNKLPSLSMVVVKDGKIIYENALGFEDKEKNIKADVNKTVYRIGSVSKLFTETAIMQLYEKGKIDLKEDANKYLKDVKIQNKFKKKVTVENLLTHTSGIDEATTAYWGAKDEKDMLSLSEFLKKHQPVVVTEPGKICLYSNIGIDILGNIVENVSGMKYEEYIEKNIYSTLNMNNSKVGLPLKNMAKNYEDSMEVNNYYYNDNPAGGLNSSPDDIAKFMIAHLQNGEYCGKKILNKETAQLMHERHFSNNKSLTGVSYGFWEKDINGRRFIGHEGALSIGYFDDMLLYPEENLGIYIVSNNLTSAAPAITNMENALIKKLYPDNIHKEYLNSTIDSEEGKKYAGTYRSYHDNAKKNISKFFSFLIGTVENEDVKIEYDKSKNALIYHGTSHLKQKENVALVKVSKNLFRRADNNELVAFKEDGGKIRYVFFNTSPYDSFERVDLKDSYKLNSLVFLLSIVFFMYNILKGIVLFLVRIFRRKPSACKNKFIRANRKLFFLISLLNITAITAILY